MKQKQLNNLIKLITVCATAFIVILVGIIICQYAKMNKIKSQISTIQNQIDDYNNKRLETETDIKQWQTNTYIEEYIRGELGLIKDDEIVFEIE